MHYNIFREKSCDNDKFLCKRNDIDRLQICPMKHKYKKCLEHFFSFATISFDHFFASLSRAKRLLSNLGAALNNEESVAGFAKETQRRNTRDTSLFKKKREREREPSSSPRFYRLAVLDSLHWSRYFHLALVFKAVHGYLVFCSGNKAGKLSFRGAKAARQRWNSRPLPPDPPPSPSSLAELRSNEERRRGGRRGG